MTEAADAAPVPPGPTAGALLRRAREAQGLHIAALAASLKVPPRRLEALEQDRYDELPDRAFTRALAQAICRTLKVDAAPVLALLPRADGGRLDHVATGLNTPFRDRPSAVAPAMGNLLARPVVWLVAMLLLGALAVFFWPAPSAMAPALQPAPEPAQPAASAGEGGTGLTPAEPEPRGETVHSAPAPEADPVAAEAAAAPASVAEAGAAGEAAAAAPGVQGLLALRTTEASWIEVTDANRRTLLSRTVQPGETVGLDGALPLRLTIGNASATQLSFRGRPVDLAPHVRDNIARLELR